MTDRSQKRNAEALRASAAECSETERSDTEPSDISTQNVYRILGYDVEKEKESDLFHFVVERSENLHLGWLRFCWACYIIGFLLMGVVLQTIWTVITI